MPRLSVSHPPHVHSSASLSNVKETPTQSAQKPTIAYLAILDHYFSIAPILTIPSARYYLPLTLESPAGPLACPTRNLQSCRKAGRKAVGKLLDAVHVILSYAGLALSLPRVGDSITKANPACPVTQALSARCVVERSDLRATILSLLRFPNLGLLRSRRHPHALRNMGLGQSYFVASAQRQVIVQTSPMSYHCSFNPDSLVMKRLLQPMALLIHS